VSTLRVLGYHRVEEPRVRRLDLAPDLVSASPTVFAQHMRLLAERFCPVGADEVLAALQRRHTLPPRAVLVTFDDAYTDFLEVAWPILRAERIPATLFVPTAFVDRPELIFWWDAVWQIVSRTSAALIPRAAGRPLALRSWSDRLAASRILAEDFKRLPAAQRAHACRQLAECLGVRVEPTRAVLGWAALRQLQADGLAIAGHGRRHELLDQLGPGAIQREVAGCRDDLVRELGRCTALFAYPNGNVNGLAACSLQAAGFQAGFTVVHGHNVLERADPRLLRRDQVAGWHRLGLAVRLSGPVAALRTRRHRLPRVQQPVGGGLH
jgi:peptidoglycan/xylan/chitin deacetylase (PgdA/CDA1 family)